MSYSLFKFIDNGAVYGFTDSLTSKSFEGVTYKPTLISTGALNLTDNFAKSSLTVKFPRTNAFARNMLTILPEVPVQLVIYQDNAAYYYGEVIEVEGNGIFIEVSCDTVFTTITRNGAVDRATPQCRHILYSEGCGVNKELFRESLSVVSTGQSILTIVGSVHPSGYYSNGLAILNGQTRGIVLHSGNNYTLMSPFIGNITGTIDLYPGCELTEAACTAKSNLINFGGFERWPITNPYSSTGAL